MSIGTSIYNILFTDSGITSLVANQIYPNYATQGKQMPMIVYVILSSDPEDTKDLTGDIEDIRVQINVLARTYASIEAISDAVKTRLNRFSGFNSGVTFQTITYNGYLDVPAELDDIYQRAIDFKFRRYI